VTDCVLNIRATNACRERICRTSSNEHLVVCAHCALRL